VFLFANGTPAVVWGTFSCDNSHALLRRVTLRNIQIEFGCKNQKRGEEPEAEIEARSFGHLAASLRDHLLHCSDGTGARLFPDLKGESASKADGRSIEVNCSFYFTFPISLPQFYTVPTQSQAILCKILHLPVIYGR
jgi:hypothetical protein